VFARARVDLDGHVREAGDVGEALLVVLGRVRLVADERDDGREAPGPMYATRKLSSVVLEVQRPPPRQTVRRACS
jgi:hypothetical protein